MILRRLSLAVFIFVFALCVVHVMYYYPLLPEKVASHFGLSGQPDAWSTKTFFVTRYFVITGILAIIFLGISLGFSKIPV